MARTRQIARMSTYQPQPAQPKRKRLTKEDEAVQGLKIDLHLLFPIKSAVVDTSAQILRGPTGTRVDVEVQTKVEHENGSPEDSTFQVDVTVRFPATYAMPPESQYANWEVSPSSGRLNWDIQRRSRHIFLLTAKSFICDMHSPPIPTFEQGQDDPVPDLPVPVTGHDLWFREHLTVYTCLSDSIPPVAVNMGLCRLDSNIDPLERSEIIRHTSPPELITEADQDDWREGALTLKCGEDDVWYQFRPRASDPVLTIQWPIDWYAQLAQQDRLCLNAGYCERVVRGVIWLCSLEREFFEDHQVLDDISTLKAVLEDFPFPALAAGD